VRGRLLLGLLGAGTVWLLHLCASYFVVAVGCARGWPALGLLLALLTLAGAAGALGAGRAARSGRTVEPPRPAPGEPDPDEPVRFVAEVGARLGWLFAFMIALAGVAPLVLPPCAGG
jgi:hypothetical protein